MGISGQKNEGTAVLSHPDIPPTCLQHNFINIFCFPVEIEIETSRFDAIDGIQKNLAAELNTITAADYAKSFQSLYERCNKCIRSLEDYFEGNA